MKGIKGFIVVVQAVYYADCSGTGPRGPGMPDAALHRLDLQTREDRVLGTLERYRGSLTVSPDEKTILYQSVMKAGSDLMLVEGFR